MSLWVVETYTSVAIPTGGSLSYTLKIGNLRTGQNNIKLCKIVVSFKVNSTDKEETLQDNGSGSFAATSTGTSEFISAGTINYVTGAVSLTLESNVTEISSLEFRYETYDVDGVNENIDIKNNQIIRYNKSQIQTETVE
jgi:hypothetical protein